MKIGPRRGLLVPALAVVLVGGSIFQEALIGGSGIWWFSLLCGVMAVGCVISISGLWSISGAFILVCALFHLGLIPFLIFELEPELYGAPLSWLYASGAKSATWLVSLGLLAFALGHALHARRRRLSIGPQSQDSKMRDTVERAGALITGVTVVVWFRLVLGALGPSFFLSSYDAYKSATASEPLDYIFFFMSLGMLLLGVGRQRSAGRVGLAMFVAFALVALPLGLRGEVLFPSVAYGVMRAGAGQRMPRPAMVLALAVIALAVIGGIKEVRQVGLDRIPVTSVTLSPLNGLGELGYTLRTVYAVQAWHASGTPPRHGATYVAPIERAAARLDLAKPQPPANFDLRLMNVEMRAREGNLGGSVLAEGVRNFNEGAIVLMFLLGLGCAAVERSTSLRGQLMGGVVLVCLLQHVRNSFTPVPLQLASGLILVGLVFLLFSGRRVHANGPAFPRSSRQRSVNGPGTAGA